MSNTPTNTAGEIHVQKLIKEVQTTEVSYLKSILKLQAFRNLLNTPNAAHGTAAYKFFHSKEGRNMIQELEKIDSVILESQKFLEAIKDKKDKNDNIVAATSQEVANAVLSVNFASYHSFVPAMDRISKLEVSLRKNEYFTELSKKHFTTEDGGLNFNSCLITPIQRVPRYRLLLDELIKGENRLNAVSPRNEVISALTESLEKVKVEASAINESQRTQENADKQIATNNARMKALSQKYSSPENRKLRTTEPKPGNLSAVFKTPEDLKALENQLNKGHGQKFIVKCDDLKKQPLVIHCVSDKNPKVILYKIIQNKKEPNGPETFSVRIKPELAKTLDSVGIELALTKAENVAKACGAVISAKTIKPEPSPVVAAPVPVAAPEPAAPKVSPTPVPVAKPEPPAPAVTRPATTQKKLQAAQEGLGNLSKEPNQPVQQEKSPINFQQQIAIQQQSLRNIAKERPASGQAPKLEVPTEAQLKAAEMQARREANRKPK
ncbi:MAG TPA: RhoGEF domain-containing protein [Gammaproteobacteria bacterium]|nr:RhoGEF domain-containing protein [Gammaproteobacteria bacterium]